MATHSSTLAWRLPWTEKPGRLQSMGSLRVRQDWATSLSLFTFMHWRRKWQPTLVFLPGESQGRGSLVGCVYGVTQSRTRLMWLSSSSSRKNESQNLKSNLQSYTEEINEKATRLYNMLVRTMESGVSQLWVWTLLALPFPSMVTLGEFLKFLLNS